MAPMSIQEIAIRLWRFIQYSHFSLWAPSSRLEEHQLTVGFQIKWFATARFLILRFSHFLSFFLSHYFFNKFFVLYMKLLGSEQYLRIGQWRDIVAVDGVFLVYRVQYLWKDLKIIGKGISIYLNGGNIWSAIHLRKLSESDRNKV